MLQIFLQVIKTYKKTILLFISLFIILTSIYTYFSVNCYLAKATIEVESIERVHTEVEVIKSRLLLNQALKKVDLSHRYYLKKNLKEREFYKESPFKVYLSKGYNLSFDLNPIDDKHYRLVSKSNDKTDQWEYDKIHSYSQQVNHSHFNLIIILRDDIPLDQEEFRFIVEDKQTIIKNISKRIQVKRIKESSIIEISYVDTISKRAIDIVNALAHTSVEWSRDAAIKKNKISLADFQSSENLITKQQNLASNDANNENNKSDTLNKEESQYLDTLSKTLTDSIENNISLESFSKSKSDNSTATHNIIIDEKVAIQTKPIEKTDTKSNNRKYLLDTAIDSKSINLHTITILLIGVLFGFVIGTVVAFRKSLIDNKITDYNDLKKNTKSILLGYIPHFKKSYDSEGNELPDLMRSESFRVVRDNLKFMANDPTTQVICITSHSEGDGKSTIATHLAESYSHAGERVIVLDLDMQNPTIHQKFNLFNDEGMSTVLSHRAMISDAIEYTSSENIDIVTAGSPPPNPWELISSPRMFDVIKKLKNVYDVIIIDTPAIGIDVSRANTLSFSDINLYVLRADVTERDILDDIDTFALLLNDVS